MTITTCLICGNPKVYLVWDEIGWWTGKCKECGGITNAPKEEVSFV